MRRKLIVVLALAGLGGTLAACGDESPTAVGAGLIGPGMTTFEVVLDGSEFLLGDTTYDSLGELSQASFRILAEDFGGELDAHTLFRISRPFTVSYQAEENGVTQVDSILSFKGARLTLVLDTLASEGAFVDVEVLPVTESWHAGSVTWELRYDTAGVSEPWTTPGGTTGPVAGSAVWSSGDTLVIPIDSASAAVWQDTTAAQMGGLIRLTRPGTRLRVRSLNFSFDVVPVGMPDTVVSAGGLTAHMHIVSPMASPAPVTELRTGGLPAWRALLHFRTLEDLVVDACGSGGLGTGDPECDVAVRDASLNLAQLLLTPAPVAGRRIELPVLLRGWRVLATENVPVFRAPVAALAAASDSVLPEFFTVGGADGPVVAVPITDYVRDLAGEREEDAEQPLQWLALLSSRERETLGYAAFSSLESASPPRLRLVLTIPNEEIFQ